MTWFRDLAQGFSPQLRGYLMIHMSERWISSVPYFRGAPHALIIDVAEAVRSRFFARRETLSDLRFCLCIVERGTLAYGYRIITTGSVFGQDMILSNRALQDQRRSLSLTYCQILVLIKPALDKILSEYPRSRMDFQHWAARLALCRTVRLCAKLERKMRSTGQSPRTLAETFDELRSRKFVIEAETAIAGAVHFTSDSSGSDYPPLASQPQAISSRLSRCASLGVRGWTEQRQALDSIRTSSLSKCSSHSKWKS